MDIDKVKATIRQLLNLAGDDGAAAGEIANAMRFANKLMEQHQLSEDDLSEVDDILLNLERAEMGKQTAYCESTKMAFWEGQVAMFVCKFVGGVKCHKGHTDVVKSAAGIVQLDPKTGQPMRKQSIVFYGISEDVDLARQLHCELVITIASMGRLKYGGVFRNDGRSYCEGFVAGLNTQLKDDNARELLTAKKTGGSALMVVESRQAIVERKEDLADKFIGRKLKGGRSSYRSHSATGAGAYSTGRSDGARHSTSVTRTRKLTG